MRKKLLAAAAANGGVIGRDHALSVAVSHVIEDAVRDGCLIRIFPRVYALPTMTSQPEVRRHGALLSVPDVALSHIDGLAIWDLPGQPRQGPAGFVHLTRSFDLPAVDVAGLKVHRRRGFMPEAPQAVFRNDLRVVRMEQAIVESWPLLMDVDQRLPAIVAVRDRRTTARRLLATLDRQPKTAGAAEMRELFGLLEFGNHSHLELWGHQRVFSDPRLAASRCQVPEVLPNGQKVYLDRLFEAEMLNVELDGAAYHGKPGQRERDIRRDAALATKGYLTLRFSHLRLHADPEGVILEILATLAMRRRQFGLLPA